MSMSVGFWADHVGQNLAHLLLLMRSLCMACSQALSSLGCILWVMGFEFAPFFETRTFIGPKMCKNCTLNTSLVNSVISTNVPTPGMTNIFTIGCFQIGQFYKITLVTA